MGREEKARPALIREAEHIFEGVAEIVKNRWPPGYRSPKQAHGMSEGYVHVLSGEVYAIIAGAKDGEIRFGAGASFVLPAGAIHAVGSLHGAETLECNIPPIGGLTTIYEEEI
jgi:quercetin dioxygenase-like cupin family protein